MSVDALSEAAITAEGRNPRVFSGLEATTGKNILKTVSASLNPLSLVSWAVPSISSLATMGSGIHGKVWTLRVMCTCVCVHACAYTSLLKWLLYLRVSSFLQQKPFQKAFPARPGSRVLSTYTIRRHAHLPLSQEKALLLYKGTCPLTHMDKLRVGPLMPTNTSKEHHCL